MTGRIRWTGADGTREFATFLGYTGTLDVPQFTIYAPDEATGGEHPEEWLLASRLPGQDYVSYGDGPEPLKACAEERLEEFAASIGAIFLEPPPTRDSPATGEAT